MEILIGFLIAVALAVICVLVANAKGRDSWLWGILGFLFGFISLIVLAALPGTGPLRDDVDTDVGVGLRPEPEVESPVFTPAQFRTPVIGLIVGLIFALIFLQATKLSLEDVLSKNATQDVAEEMRRSISEMPPVVLLWPVSPGLEPTRRARDRSAAGLVWQRFPSTLEVMILGGALAVVLAWGLALGSKPL